MIVLVLIFVIFLCIFSKYYFEFKNLYKEIDGVHGPKTVPILGNLLMFYGLKDSCDFNKLFNRMLEDYPPPMKFFLGPYPYYVTAHPEEIETILKHPEAIQKLHYYKVLVTATGQGLITAPAKIWKKNRKLIEPTFNQLILNDFVPIFVKISQNLVETLKQKVDKGFFDVRPMVNEFMVNIILETVMGTTKKDVDPNFDCGALASRGTAIAHKRIFTILGQINMLYKWTPLAIEGKNIIKELNKFVIEMIGKRREKLRGDFENCQNEATVGDFKTKKRVALLDFLLEMEESGNITSDQIRAEVLTFFIAGFDTGAFVVSLTFIMLGMFPRIQEKVFNEVMEVLGSTNDIKNSDLSKLKYLEMVLKETMRLFPVTFFIGRRLHSDIKLKSTTIPKGTNVIIPKNLVHKNEKFWPKPLEFDPERFNPEECAKRNPFNWLPFSGGPRNCIGMRYAFMEMKTIIATIIKEFKIETSYKKIEEIHITPSIVNEVTDGCNCSFQLRKK